MTSETESSKTYEKHILYKRKLITMVEAILRHVNLLLRNKFNAIAHSSRPLLRSTLVDSDLKIKKKKNTQNFYSFYL